MLLRALTHINQDDKAELRAWTYDTHDWVVWKFIQEKGMTRRNSLPIQTYKDIGTGWFSESTYEYGKYIYMVVFTSFEENPNYNIDCMRDLMTINQWQLRDPQ
jgi:hypothetical protein